MLSSLVPIFKGKGDPCNPNSCRRIKLLEDAFELYEVLDGRLPEVVDIDKMQYGFMSGRQTVDTRFVLSRLSEKFRAIIRSCFLYLLTSKRLLIGCQRKLFLLL